MKSQNPRITLKELGLIKGALRRVFSRSDLRKQALDKYSIEYTDPNRPRVTKWGYCGECGELTPKYLLEIDHVNPIVPIISSFYEMSLDDLVDNLWCDAVNLKAMCKDCHKIKSKLENFERRKFKKKGK